MDDFEKHVKLIFVRVSQINLGVEGGRGGWPRQNCGDVIREYAFRSSNLDHLDENVDRRAGETDCTGPTRCRLQTEGCGYRFQRGMHEHCGMCLVHYAGSCRCARVVCYTVAYTVTRGIDERACKITSCSPRCYRPRT